jgi:hypothetical protein
MKKLAALSLAAGVLAMTSGCSMLPQSAPAPTVTVTASASPSASASAGAEEIPGPDAAAPAEETSPSADAAGLSKTMWDYQDGKVSDEKFVGFVRENTTTLGPYEQDMMVVLAQTTCAAVANGTTKAEILEKQVAMAQSRQEGELTKEMGRDIGYLLGAGAKNYCPELSDELIRITNS